MVAKRSSLPSEAFGLSKAHVPSGALRIQGTRKRPLQSPAGERSFTIRAASPDCPDAHALLGHSQNDLLRYLPADEIFSLTPADLSAPNVTLLIARLDKRAVGCVALVDYTTYGEVKRLFVCERYRRQGVAQRLMVALEQLCRDIGLLRVKLETSPLLTDAQSFYTNLGYRERDRFGDYPVLDSSLFMEKHLGGQG